MEERSFRLETEGSGTHKEPEADSFQTWNFKSAAYVGVTLQGEGPVGSRWKRSVPTCMRVVLVAP